MAFILLFPILAFILVLIGMFLPSSPLGDLACKIGFHALLEKDPEGKWKCSRCGEVQDDD